MTTATDSKTAEYRACACGRFEAILNPEINEADGTYTADEERTTQCGAKTLRTFAPGHDAKLKGLLIWAGSVGAEVREHQGGVDVVSDAERVAQDFGFQTQVIAGIAREQARIEVKKAKKLARDAARLERAAKKTKTNGKKADEAFAEALAEVKAEVAVDKPRLGESVKAKVGRWEYRGFVQGDRFVYTDKSGTEKWADKYTIIEK